MCIRDRVKEVVTNGVVVYPIDQSEKESIRVALNRVRRCPQQVPDQFWPTRKGGKGRVKDKNNSPAKNPVKKTPQPENVWSSRLRPHISGRGRPDPKGGEL